MLKLLPQAFFDPAEPGVLRILNEDEWRGLGITQSMGWEHYEVHAPEPHILLFRREKDFLQKVRTVSPLAPPHNTDQSRDISPCSVPSGASSQQIANLSPKA